MNKPITMPGRPLQPKPPQNFLFVDLPAIEEMLAKETVYCVHCGAVVAMFPPEETGKHDLEFHADRLGEDAEFTAQFITSSDRTKEELANLRSNFAGAILQTRMDLRKRALLAGWIKLVAAPPPPKVIIQ